MFSSLGSRLPVRGAITVFRRNYFKQRLENNRKPQGLTKAELDKHYALKPLFLIMGIAGVFVASFVGRLILFSPDVNYSKKDAGEIADYYTNKRFKFLNPQGVDYSNISQVPKYKD